MQIFEDNPSQKLTATSISQTYNIIEAAGMDYWAVRAALLAYAPLSNAPPGAIYAWPRRGLSLDEIEATTGTWKATITWASLNYQYALKIGGQQETVRQSKQVMASAGTGIPAWLLAQPGAPIGWDGRTVHGTSIYVPQRNWTESVEIPVSDYSFDYEDAVYAVQAAPVNSASFRGYHPGQVRFLGMNAQLNAQNPDFVSAAYEFSMSPNFTAAGGNPITIGGMTIDKKGWEYLDVFSAPVVDLTVFKLAPQPQYALVHRLYDLGDFSRLNIGTDENLPLWQG